MPEAPTALQLKTDPRSLQFKHLLESDAMQRSLQAALPKHLSVAKIIRLVLGAFQRTPKLLECTPESILYSLMTSATMGLEPDGGPLGQGYLVPFWNGKTHRLECQFIPGYRGLVKLARNSGEIEDVYAEVVYGKDTFHYEKGLEQTLTHKRNDEDMDVGQLRYAYAVAVFRSGYKKFEVMNRREIEAVKAKSASKNKQGEIVGPWTEHEAEMWKKTAVRRLAKMLPLSVDIQRTIADDAEELEVKLPDMTALPTFEAPQLEHDQESDLDAPAAEQKPTAPAGPLPEADMSRVAVIQREIADAVTLVRLNEIDQREQDATVAGWCHARREQIRATRGGKRQEQAGLPLEGEGGQPA